MKAEQELNRGEQRKRKDEKDQLMGENNLIRHI